MNVDVVAFSQLLFWQKTRKKVSDLLFVDNRFINDYEFGKICVARITLSHAFNNE